MILLPHFDIPYSFRLGKIPYEFPFQGPVFFVQLNNIFKVLHKSKEMAIAYTRVKGTAPGGFTP